MQKRNALIFSAIIGALAATIAGTDAHAALAALMGSVVTFGLLYVLSDWREDRAGQKPVAQVEKPVNTAPDPDFTKRPGSGLVEKFPTPLLVIAQNGSLLFANSFARKELPRAVVGTHFAHIIRAPAFISAIEDTLSDGQDRTFQFTSYDAKERISEARVSIVRDRALLGPDPHAIVQIEDRTQEYKSEQLRADFIANASHELRTPLASIIGYIETLQNHAREDPSAREKFLSIMGREAGRMQRLVDDLMSLSRIEMNEHVRPSETLSLNAIARECVNALRPLAEQFEIELSVDLDPDAVYVVGDRDQMAQVFTNLIDNALKYSDKGDKVHVFQAPKSKAHPNRCGISVQDTGSGIPRDLVHRLTERFFRVNVPQSKKKGGTGLGLAIVKHILNRHNGRIEVQSVVGDGSTFTVWMPCEAGCSIADTEDPARIVTDELENRSA